MIINTTTLRNNLSDALDKIVSDKKYLLVSRRGEIESALVDIELFEDLLAAANKDYLKSIKKARQEYQKGEIFTHEEVFGQV